MELIDGNAIAARVLAELHQAVQPLPLDDRPHVAFIRVGEDPASVFYVGKKQKTAADLGFGSSLHLFPETVTEAELFAKMDALNADPSVHGILVQAPLPKHLSERATFNRVSPHKDVDGFHEANLGRLCQEDENAFVACTPSGVAEMIHRAGIETEGKHVVVLGRSLIVGKPAALLFLRKHAQANATVTVCHSRTRDLAAVTRTADILIAAMGMPEFVRGDMVKEGAVVIDVGINRVEDTSRPRGYRITGDVHFEEVAPLTSFITPVPGGVGPMTVAMLMKNTLKAYHLQKATPAH